MGASLAGAFGCMMAAQHALAEPQASDLAGRWVSTLSDARTACGNAGCQLAYDLVPCGGGWCGIEVKDDKSCGRTSFRLDAGAPSDLGIVFSGRYEAAAGTQPYFIQARLSASSAPTEQGQLFLLVLGSTISGGFQPFRRHYPMEMFMSRAGDATCRAEAKVS